MNLPDPTDLSLAQKVGQLFFIGIPGPELDDETGRLLFDILPGGVCLFARNIKTPEQTRQLLADVRASLPVEPFLSVDQEGGLVDRLRRILAPLPAVSKLRSLDDVKEQASIIADSLLALGFNMDFAPVVDVARGEASGAQNGLNSRTYGSLAPEVASSAAAFLEVLRSRGLVGCLKHFPGLGASVVDSHEELPSVEITENELRDVDLLPYRDLTQHGAAHSIMVGHAVYPAFGLQERGGDGRLLPSSLSFNIVTTLLREELNFNGVVVTDDLEMGAILKNYGIGEAAVTAIAAGNDMVAICAGVENIRRAHESVLKAFTDGRLNTDLLDNALGRIFRLKSELAAPPAFDPEVISSLTQRSSDLTARLS